MQLEVRGRGRLPPATATPECFHAPSTCSWNLRILVVPLVSSCRDACLMSLIVNWCLSMMLDLRYAPLPSPCDPFLSQFPPWCSLLIARPAPFRVLALDRSHLDPAPASKQLGTTHGQMQVEGPVEVRALEMLLATAKLHTVL